MNLQKERYTTDYSGRTFKNITAYEYAYWAKDWHMCRMLEAQMDAETKALTLRDCEKIDRDGLTYKQQRGDEMIEVIGSKHFDFRPLKEAYADYIQIYDRWVANANSATAAELDAAWFTIGVMQRDVPAYVAQEYCRPGRSFHPRPVFNEPNLPRHMLTFYNYKTAREEQWFPLVISGTSGLGVDFALIRAVGTARGVGSAGMGGMGGMAPPWPLARIDLAAVTSLDEASTIELTRSRDNLKPLAHGQTVPGLSY